MNKTVSINLAGQVFQIDENAFEQLKKYLESIRVRFAGTEGKDEIIADIESRIGEMFAERLTDKKQVILLNDVNDIIGIMGKPEDFEQGVEAEEPKSGTAKTSKRLFRNPDDKIIGGVCSGLSAYLGINDPIWLRLIFLLTLFFGFGSSFLIYVVLWLIVPAAKTTSEKLEMKGENVNISNIEKTIKEDLADLKDRLSNINSNENKGKARNAIERVVGLVISIIVFLFKFIFRIAAIVLIFVGIVLTIGFLAAVFLPIGIFGTFLPALYPLVFGSQTILFLGATGLILLLCIPAIALIYLGFRILLNRKLRVRGLGLSMLGLWIVGLMLTSFVAIKTATEFSTEQSVQQVIPISQPAGNTLYLDVKKYGGNDKNEYYTFFGFDFMPVDDNLLLIDNIKLDVRKSMDGDFKLVKTAIARGRTKIEAFDRAEKIGYEVMQNDSQLTFQNFLTMNMADKFRHQEIQLVLNVPEGKSVHLGADTRNIIYDIKNVHDMYDGNMVGHTWTMLPAGLTCLDCNWEKEEENAHEGSAVKRDIDLKDFSEVEVGGNFRVEIKQGDDFNISVSGDREFADNIEIAKDNNKLTIGTENKIFNPFKSREGYIEVTLPSLTNLEINGANNTTVSGFDQQKMTVQISGASTVKLDVNAGELELDINGASNVTLEGTGKNLNLEVTGASKINAFDFETDKCNTKVTGASNAHINAREKLEANASGASNIIYKGLPEISSDVSGFSSIKPKQ